MTLWLMALNEDIQKTIERSISVWKFNAIPLWASVDYILRTINFSFSYLFCCWKWNPTLHIAHKSICSSLSLSTKPSPSFTTARYQLLLSISMHPFLHSHLKIDSDAPSHIASLPLFRWLIMCFCTLFKHPSPTPPSPTIQSSHSVY